jgi:hypothetical protein
MAWSITYRTIARLYGGQDPNQMVARKWTEFARHSGDNARRIALEAGFIIPE